MVAVAVAVVAALVVAALGRVGDLGGDRRLGRSGRLRSGRGGPSRRRRAPGSPLIPRVGSAPHCPAMSGEHDVREDQR